MLLIVTPIFLCSTLILASSFPKENPFLYIHKIYKYIYRYTKPYYFFLCFRFYRADQIERWGEEGLRLRRLRMWTVVKSLSPKDVTGWWRRPKSFRSSATRRLLLSSSPAPARFMISPAAGKKQWFFLFWVHLRLAKYVTFYVLRLKTEQRVCPRKQSKLLVLSSGLKTYILVEIETCVSVIWMVVSYKP